MCVTVNLDHLILYFECGGEGNYVNVQSKWVCTTLIVFQWSPRAKLVSVEQILQDHMFGLKELVVVCGADYEILFIMVSRIYRWKNSMKIITTPQREHCWWECLVVNQSTEETRRRIHNVWTESKAKKIYTVRKDMCGYKSYILYLPSNWINPPLL